MPKNRRWLRHLLTALVIAAPVVRYLSHDLPLFFIANADMLAVPAVAESVQRHGLLALSEWYWPPAPYLLTDVVPYGVLWFAMPNVWLAPAVFMAGQLLVGFLAIRWLARGLVDDAELADWGALGSFAVLVGFATALADPARFLLVSYYRAGSFLLCLLALGVLVRWVGQGRPDTRRWVAGAVVAATAATVSSDPLMIPAAAGPLVLVIGLLCVLPSEHGGWRDDWRPGLRLGSAVVVGVVLGVFVNGLIVTKESTYGPSLTGDGVRTQATMLLDLFDEASASLRVAAVASVLVAVLVLMSSSRSRVSPLMVVVAFWVISSGAHVVAMLLDTSEPALRYVQVVALLPLVWVGPLLAQRLSGRRWTVGPLAAFAALVVILPSVGELDEVDLSYQAPEAACLDAVVPGDGVGVSGYWEARLVQLHSHFERDLAPLDGAGEPMRINASSAWFDQPYDFALVGTQTPGWDPPLSLMEALAPQATATECGTLVILDAGDGGLRLDALAGEGGQVAFDGCDLQTMTGSLDAATCSIDVPAGASGFATFGGYASLPPGTYEIELAYSSDGAPDAKLGTLEVTRVREYGGEVEVVLTAPLFAPSEPGPGTITVSVAVPDDGDPFIAEMRTVTDGAQSYRVEGVTITRR